MTKEEHELMVQMFARVFEAIDVLKDTLKSRDLWTDDDERAFSHAVHADPSKILRSLVQAYSDYTKLASDKGLVTGLAPLQAPPAS